MFYVVFEVQSVFVTVWHLEYPLIGLIFYQNIYEMGFWLKNVERQHSPKIAKWVKKKYDVVV